MYNMFSDQKAIDYYSLCSTYYLISMAYLSNKDYKRNKIFRKKKSGIKRDFLPN